jgi:hypothetical protein
VECARLIVQGWRGEGNSAQKDCASDSSSLKGESADHFPLAPPRHHLARQRHAESSELNGVWGKATLVASDTSIEAALEPVKFFECVCKGGCDGGSRFVVQSLSLD